MFQKHEKSVFLWELLRELHLLQKKIVLTQFIFFVLRSSFFHHHAQQHIKSFLKIARVVIIAHEL